MGLIPAMGGGVSSDSDVYIGEPIELTGIVITGTSNIVKNQQFSSALVAPTISGKTHVGWLPISTDSSRFIGLGVALTYYYYYLGASAASGTGTAKVAPVYINT